MSICSRCKSGNNQGIKYCNFCGARMISSVSFDCYGTSALAYDPAPQSFDEEVEPVSNKLAYRYFLKGRHAFSAGDLNRATLMFQCALDANPSDQKVKSFLKRAVDLKNSSDISEPVDMSSMLRYDFSNHRPRIKTVSHLKVVESFQQVQSSTKQREFGSLPEPVKSVAFQKSGALKSTVAHSSASTHINASTHNSAVAHSSASTYNSAAVHNSAATHINAAVHNNAAADNGAEFDPWDTIPSSPAELLDSAPENGRFNDLIATLAALTGLLLFGFVLTM